jgi:two-component system sensor histidine kinase CreC
VNTARVPHASCKANDGSTVMVVSAPVTAGAGGATIGVLAVAKPLATVQQFIDRAEDKIFTAGAWLLGLSLAVGVAVTLWTVHGVRRLRLYAQQARAGERHPVPRLPGELGELASAMGHMRDRLEDRAQVEHAMRALTHELKSPLTAIGGAAEFLSEELPAADRERFAGQVTEQVQRLRQMVDRLLELSKLESLRAPEQVQPLALPALLQTELDAVAPLLAQRRLQVRWLQADTTPVPADAERLAFALSNLLANAIDFAPEGSALELSVQRRGCGHGNQRARPRPRCAGLCAAAPGRTVFLHAPAPRRQQGQRPGPGHHAPGGRAARRHAAF